MKTSHSNKFTAQEIRERSKSWLRFITNADRAILAAKVKEAKRGK